MLFSTFDLAVFSLLLLQICQSYSFIGSQKINTGKILKPMQNKSGKQNSLIFKMTVEIAEFDDSTQENGSEVDNRTDEEKGLTHGYEGNFKVGDKVRVKNDIRIWSVKPYMKEGFVCKNYCGVVHSLALYGRKKKSLCSAITPIRVQFQPNSEGVPEGMLFEKAWIGHFDKDELELLP